MGEGREVDEVQPVDEVDEVDEVDDGAREPRDQAGPGRARDGAEDRVCDFCGSAAPVVRRVALDRDYDRLARSHAVRYACPDCSEKKEAERRDRGAS